MTRTAAPICVHCTHLRADKAWACEAFPDGIPDTILENREDHRKPVDGDNGVQFEDDGGLLTVRYDAIFGTGDKKADRAVRFNEHGYNQYTGPGPGSDKLEAALARSESFPTYNYVDWSPTDDDVVSMMQDARINHPGAPPPDPGPNAGVMYTNEDGDERIVVYNGPDGEPAGYVSINVLEREIYSVAILSTERGKGIGTAMYDWVQDKGVINLYDVIGQSREFTKDGKAFAVAWLKHRLELEKERAG